MNRLLLSLAAVAITVPAQATIVTLTTPFNTGVDAGGVPLGTGGADPHFAWVGVPPSGGPTPVVLDHGAFPVPPWLDIAAGPTSRWIAPTTNANGNAGSYIYRTTFTVPAGVDPSQVYLRGRWASDDPGATITVNGVASGITNGSGFTAWSDFAIQR